MTTYKFTIPNRDSSIFRCDVYNDGSFMYHREVHMYDKNLTEEINTLVLAKKMGQTLDIDERDLYVPTLKSPAKAIALASQVCSCFNSPFTAV